MGSKTPLYDSIKGIYGYIYKEWDMEPLKKEYGGFGGTWDSERHEEFLEFIRDKHPEILFGFKMSSEDR